MGFSKKEFTILRGAVAIQTRSVTIQRFAVAIQKRSVTIQRCSVAIHERVEVYQNKELAFQTKRGSFKTKTSQFKAKISRFKTESSRFQECVLPKAKSNVREIKLNRPNVEMHTCMIATSFQLFLLAKLSNIRNKLRKPFV